MYIGVHVKYLLLLLDFNKTWIFSTDFQKYVYTKIWNFMKIRTVRAELFHADRQQTDTMKLIVAFRNFASSPKSRQPLISTLTMGCWGQCLRILPTVTYPHTLQCTVLLGRLHKHVSFTTFSRVTPLPLARNLPLSIPCNISTSAWMDFHAIHLVPSVNVGQTDVRWITSNVLQSQRQWL